MVSAKPTVSFLSRQLLCLISNVNSASPISKVTLVLFVINISYSQKSQT